MPDSSHLPALVAWLAFALAFVFGAVANRVNFCTMGAITDIVHIGNWRRMRMWLRDRRRDRRRLEAAASSTCRADPPTPRIAWLSYLVGGFLFGFGDALLRVGAKTLIRLGGSPRSLVVLIVLAISCYMTLKGLFAVWRVNTLDVVRWASLGTRPEGSLPPVWPAAVRRPG
jgi:uncharacterized membrane protein YedE/YeeE